MPVRAIRIQVGGNPTSSGITWAYPDGSAAVLYRIPIYRMTVSGTADGGAPSARDFDVFRFGVKQIAGEAPHIVGLADAQTYTIQMWLPEYRVHSQQSAEIGAWKVFDNFLVHDGPDDPQSRATPYATVGCIELCGPAQFNALNDFIVALCGLTTGTRADKLNAIGNSGMLRIIYDAAARPALTPA